MPGRRAGVADADLSAVYELEIDPKLDVLVAAARYGADPAVEWAPPAHRFHVAAVPDDPHLATSGSWGQPYADLWGLLAIEAPSAWDVSTGEGTVVAVVDTGIDAGHPDLAGRLFTNPGEVPGNGVVDDGNGYADDVAGYDFDGRDPDPDDLHGHGTHVAGTVAAAAGNGIGLAGVAHGARIMPVTGLGDDGIGEESALIEALFYAAANGADVVNLSWGGFSVPSQAMFDAVRAVDALGVVVVAAAGNEGRELEPNFPAYLPAGHPDALTVGALDPDGGLASFSNRGAGLSLLAPGVDILSLRSLRNRMDRLLYVDREYLRLLGTSTAAPHAAGAAALLLAARPELTTAEVRWHLELNADQPGAPGYEGLRHDPTFGYGVLDAGQSFDPPPVTTRLRPPFVREWHAFPTTRAIPGRPGSFLFTTLDPVPWSISTPPWLRALRPGGTGPDLLELEIDADGPPPGSYTGEVVLAAPGAVGGGDRFPVELHVHEDLRLGGRIQVGRAGWGHPWASTPRSAPTMWPLRSPGRDSPRARRGASRSR